MIVAALHILLVGTSMDRQLSSVQLNRKCTFRDEISFLISSFPSNRIVTFTFRIIFILMVFSSVIIDHVSHLMAFVFFGVVWQKNYN